MIKAANGTVLDYTLIIAGCFLLAVSLGCFLEPKEIVIGGATGLSIIIDGVCRNFLGFSLPLWLGNILINVPLFVVSIKVYGLKFLERTLFATLFLSFALFVVGFIPAFEVDYPIACVIGSALSGWGIGLIFKSNATTGGSDLGASLLRKVINHPVSRLMLYIDSAIILTGFFIFGSIPTFYAIIGAYIIAKVIDLILGGAGYAKAAYIISDKCDEVSRELSRRLERGVTRIYGEGGYSKEKKDVLICVIQVKQMAKLKEITAEIDKKAFIFISDVKEVLGEFDIK